MIKDNSPSASGLSRRRLLRQAVATGTGIGALSVGGQHFGFIPAAFADDKPPIGTWPAGSQGDTVNVGAAVPRTGTYAVQGEDELKGWQLAVEHINEGNALIKKIAPKITKGLLGKKVNLLVADFGGEAKRRRAGGADLHQSEQDHSDDRLDLKRGRGRTQ